MDFSQYSIWEGMLHFGLLALLLLTGNVLRRKVPLLRKSLLPTAVIAGFLGLAIKDIILVHILSASEYEHSVNILRVITYHAIALGFIALGLKTRAAVKVKAKKDRSIFSGLLIVSTYMIQGLIGLILSITMAYTIFPSLFKASGLLLPMGFGQGPGQAQNIGSVYELEHGFAGGTTFGLAIASFGFIWASVAGIIYLNMLYKNKKLFKSTQARRHLVSAQEIDTPDEIPVAEAIDKFTVQVALVLMVYVFTYLFIFMIKTLVGNGLFGDFGESTVLPLVIGFNFIFGMLFALLFKHIFIFFRKINIMTRQYPNNFMLNRIAGTVFDFMIVASIAAIRIEDLKSLWIPFLIMTIVIGFVTLFFVIYMTKRIYPEYPLEASLGMFGMLTGTASTGIILLREADPNFETPVANDLVVGSSTAILFGFPILLLVGIAPMGTLQTFVSLGIIIILFTGMVSAILYFNPRIKKDTP
ncbi:MAG: sodium/glutamate symporter [Bacillota bacterium]